MNTKTHWLQSPNKNYLGHWDLPENVDLILTIKSADWEAVENPITKDKKECRVVRFNEDVKPFICNQTNAQSIMVSTNNRYMEDSPGFKIALYESQTKVAGETVDCIRVRRKSVKELQKPKAKKKISDSRFKQALEKIEAGEYSAEELSSGHILTDDQVNQLTAILLQNG
jgi:hypothetical protein